MKSFLTFIDIYGTKFHFYFHGYIKFNTWIGGIITILISTLLLSFFYIFEEDFFLEKILLSHIQLLEKIIKKLIYQVKK